MSTTLTQPAWNNTTVIGRDAVTRIATLKQQLAGDIVVPASFELVRALFEHGLVDELRLIVYPVVLGGGRRLFDHITGTVSLHLLDNRTLGDHLTYASYEIAIP